MSEQSLTIQHACVLSYLFHVFLLLFLEKRKSQIVGVEITIRNQVSKFLFKNKTKRKITGIHACWKVWDCFDIVFIL